MSTWGVTTLRMLDALEQHGPMTRTELCDHLGLDRTTAASIVSRLMKPSKRPVGPKRVYICDWRDDAEGERRYLRAVYAIGKKPDKPRPEYRPRLLAAKRRYWAARKQRLFVAHVCGIVPLEQHMTAATREACEQKSPGEPGQASAK